MLSRPFASFAQQPGKIWRIGFLVPTDSGSNAGGISAYGAAFVQEMQAAGHVVGADYAIEVSSAKGDYERLPALAAEMVRLNVDILIPVSPIAVRAAHMATTTVPIVCIGAHDPVGAKMAASLARPGGNLTGLASFYGHLIPKHLELVKSIVPKISRVAILANVGLKADPVALEKVMEEGRKMGLHLQHVRGITQEELTGAFAAMKRDRAGAFIGVADAAIVRERQLIAGLALKNRLPSFFATRENVQAGGLASYGENFIEMFTQAAKYVSKIMKGAKPGDLPIEQPSKFSLAINLKTAKALGLKIPQSVLVRADEVIE